MAIIPKPVKMVTKEGAFAFTPDTILVANGAAAEVGHYLINQIAPATGFHMKLFGSYQAKARRIQLTLEAELLDILGTEGYRLHIAPDQVDICAAAPAGLFYAVQSLRQLLPVQIFRQAPVASVEWKIPCVEIEDYPRFSWRGIMLDCARHFMPKEFIKKVIDLLALHKMNSFHWHLTEDQGWRIEIKRYPRLTEVGAWRKETLVGHQEHDRKTKDMLFDGKPHGGFYTQDDVREIVAYARQRFINIVPEIEMPGHSQAAIAAYPELGNKEKSLRVRNYWGICKNIFNVNESTILFLQNVLAEVLDLFPSQFIHVGGDEVPKKQWEESTAAQARMKALGLKNEEELQSYFIRRMDSFLTERGRRLIGWDEILEGGLAPNATVMSWRGEEGGIAAAKAGHDVVMAPTHATYLDYYQGEDRDKEPLGIGGYLPLETVYAYDPIPAALTPQEAKHILGAQAQLWVEYVPGPKQAEFMLFPRVSALAEVVWTPAKLKDLADFRARLGTHLQRLSILDVNYRKPD
jgi:hexosaminidase